MDVPWKNVISPWWPSAIDASVRFPVPPTPQVDELRRESWPIIVAQTSWQLPALPISSGPPQGGLLAPLNAGTSGGVLGRLATPVEHPQSASYWNGVPAPLRARGGPMPGTGYYLLRPAPAWEAVATRPAAAELPPEPPSQSPWSASAENPDNGVSPNGGGEARSALEVLSDVPPDNYWIPGAQYAGEGHHHNPRAIYGKLPLPDETRKVFDKATTGQLPLYRWHQNDALHRAYSRAIEELLDRYMQEHNIKPEQMTPDQARSVLKAIADSEEPRIRVYREMIKRMWMSYRLRSGARGSE
jgi:hypothetical protein